MKKGFTLIEIIVCISVIAIIGTASIFGIKYVTKNIKIEKLEQITDKVLQAAEVYIETHKETYNQLYNNKNGVVIPIKTLVNEGLIDLSVTTLEDDDIEDEYVITALTNTPTNDCIDITTSASWNMSKENPIYICNNSDSSGGGNSIFISSSTSNLETVKKIERTYITDYTRNYISYKTKTYRLLYIDYDDSLVLYTPEYTFGDDFNNITQETYSDAEDSTLNTTGFVHPKQHGFNRLTEKPIAVFNNKSACLNQMEDNIIDNNNYNFLFKGSNYDYSYYYNTDLSDYIRSRQCGYSCYSYYYRQGIAHQRISKTNKEQYITINDFINLGYPSYISYKKSIFFPSGIYSSGYFSECYESSYLSGMKIQLKSCMKISEGIGTEINPYKLKNMC